MTLIEWRQKRRYLKAASEMLGQSTLQEMIATLKASSPVYFQARALRLDQPITEFNHSRLLGLIEGYALALDCLESMGTPIPKPVQPTAGFEPQE